jgi:hypothetical protein
MKRVVADAGVAVHWFLRENGPDDAAALNWLADFQHGAIGLCQSRFMNAVRVPIRKIV